MGVRPSEQIDRVLGRWQRLLSDLDADTRLYFSICSAGRVRPSARTPIRAAAVFWARSWPAKRIRIVAPRLLRRFLSQEASTKLSPNY